MNARFHFCLACFISFSSICLSEPVEIIRDQWGIAHVYTDGENALFFGAGYASAEDRMFQMMMRRRLVQGRTAEVLGAGEKDKFIHSDRLFRTMGIYRRAQMALEFIDEDSRLKLEAFADGVNAYLRDYEGKLLPLFDRYGGVPEPWTAADSIALWDRVAVGKPSAWQKKYKNKMDIDEREAEGIFRPSTLRDDSAAVVSEENFRRSYPQAYEELMEIARKRESGRAGFPGALGANPKASHNWVVSGERSITGKPLLESDPQLVVNAPNTGYEIHLVGGRYNVRGFFFAGTPGTIIGFNDHCAWGVTAMNADTTSLFEEKADPDDPDQYLFNEDWLEFEIHTETIHVKDGEPVEFEVRSTRHGPVVNEFLDGVKPDEIYTATLATNEFDNCSVAAAMKMMRATDWQSFRNGMREYIGPATHLIYGDVHGDIAYHSLVKVPIRHETEWATRKGWTGDDEWEAIPFKHMPSIVNPMEECIFTANNMPVGTWHPYRLGAGFGGGPRYRRLRELFSDDPERKYSAEDFIQLIHKDSVVAPVRDFAALAIALTDEEGAANDDVARIVQVLKDWDGHLLANRRAFTLGCKIQAVMKKDKTLNPPKTRDIGKVTLDHMWDFIMPEFEETGKVPDDPILRQWIRDVLLKTAEAMRKGVPHTPLEGVVHHMKYQDNSDGFGSLAPEYDLDSPPLQAKYLNLLCSQGGETYSQIVDLADLDRSLSMMPPGISEDPRSPHFKDQMGYWVDMRLHSAPISREAVLALKESSKVIEY